MYLKYFHTVHHSDLDHDDNDHHHTYNDQSLEKWHKVAFDDMTISKYFPLEMRYVFDTYLQEKSDDCCILCPVYFATNDFQVGITGKGRASRSLLFPSKETSYQALYREMGEEIGIVPIRPPSRVDERPAIAIVQKTTTTTTTAELHQGQDTKTASTQSSSTTADVSPAYLSSCRDGFGLITLFHISDCRKLRQSEQSMQIHWREYCKDDYSNKVGCYVYGTAQELQRALAGPIFRFYEPEDNANLVGVAIVPISFLRAEVTRIPLSKRDRQLQRRMMMLDKGGTHTSATQDKGCNKKE